MDEFGVLTERFGLKPQGKSAPMAASKRDTSNGTTRDFSSNSGLNSKSPSYGQNQNSFSGGFPDDILFQSNTSNKKSPGGYDDFFDQFQTSTNKSSNGSSLDYDSIFMGSSNSGSKIYAYGNDDDDIFGLKKTTNDDVFGSFVSPPKKSDSVDDLLGGFGGGAESKLKSPKQDEAGFDDLISGFGASTSTNNGTNAKAAKSSYLSAEDPFVVLESTSSPAYGSSNSFTDPLDELGKLTQSSGRKSDGPSKASTTLKPPPKPSQVLKADKVQNPVVSSIDELEDFAMGKVRNSPVRSSVHAPKETSEWHSAKPSKYKEAEDATRKTPKESEDDLESFFSMSIRSSSAPKSRAAAPDAAFDAKTNRKGPGVAQRKPSGSSPNIKKASSTTNLVDDFSSVFGEIASVFGEFEEYEGESEERRRARLGRRQRTHDRMAKAVADMNQRDFQTQQEQEEKRRIADALDIEIKSWAAGKEGNMRALLSSLQYVLWPECGWEPVSLTDLITSSSVKKVYRKATLFVHPDKVQQKGATVQQKFIAEKVFDILKIGQGVPMTSDELVDMANSWVKTSFIGVQKSKMWSLGQVQKLNTGQWLLLLLNCIGSERCYAIYVFNCLLLQSYGVTILEHVEVDYHFIRENVVNKDIQVISTQDQVANIFTKGKTAMQFIFLRKKLTVINLLINWGGGY